MLKFAVIFINLALLFYTLGVWSEKLQKKLKLWHVVVFYAGLVCDTLGTGAMGKIAGGIFKFSFHGVTGMTAIILMMIHAIWATVVIRSDNEKRKENFHRFSIVVWMIWLIPMLSGMIFSMMK